MFSLASSRLDAFSSYSMTYREMSLIFNLLSHYNPTCMCVLLDYVVR